MFAPKTATPLLLLSAAALALAACQQAAPPADTDTASTPAGTTPTTTPTTGEPTTDAPATGPTDPSASKPGTTPTGTTPTPTAPKTSLEPPAPGEVGGLPDDRTPIAEGKIDPKSGQGAASRLERYAGLLEQGNYGAAYDFWGDGGKSSGMSKQAFIDSFAKYSEVHAMIGGPANPEGAAGSSYVTIPLQLYGRLKVGGTFNLIGPVTMRRVNDVPGASAAQLQWRINRSELKPAGKVKEVPLR